MAENPYESPVPSSAESKPVTPHTTSVRAEAWRGFKFGAKITALVMTIFFVLAGMVTLGVAIYLTVVSNGAFLNEIQFAKIAREIGGCIVGVLLMSFYAGIIGSVIMAIAAILRKRRSIKIQ